MAQTKQQDPWATPFKEQRIGAGSSAAFNSRPFPFVKRALIDFTKELNAKRAPGAKQLTPSRVLWMSALLHNPRMMELAKKYKENYEVDLAVQSEARNA